MVTPDQWSKLNQQTIFQRAFDESTDTLRTTATIGEFTGEISVDFSATDGDTVAISDPQGNIVTTTVDGPKTGMDVNVLNQLETTPTGLSKSIKTSAVVITDVAQKVPATALLDRNTMSVRIVGSSTVYFGGDDVTVNNGYPKFQYEDFIADVRDNPDVFIWAVCEPGQTCEVRVIEIA